MNCRVIAEVASNHGGDIELAKAFVHAAAENGADYVKFQSWQARNLKPDDAQYDWFVRSELTDAAHHVLIEECRKAGVGFMTTCFEVDRVRFLSSLGLDQIKIGSADTASYRMLRAAREAFDHVLLSTGMATDDEVRQAVEILRGKPFTLFHTVSLYPTPPERASLRRLRWLEQFTESVGYSDHTIGLDACKLAIGMGVSFVEKHFCLGRNGPGRVMPWDMTPAELGELTAFARASAALSGSESLPLGEDLLSARARFVGRFGRND